MSENLSTSTAEINCTRVQVLKSHYSSTSTYSSTPLLKSIVAIIGLILSVIQENFSIMDTNQASH